MHVSLQLTPFAIAVAYYFQSYGKTGDATMAYCLAKVAPIVCLVSFVLLNSLAVSPSRSLPSYKIFTWRILIGLVASLIGDVCLAIQKVGPIYLFVGIFSFALAQVFYIRAFKMTPLRPLLALPSFIISGVVFLAVRAKLNGAMLYAIPSYMLLISVTEWRSLARSKSWIRFLTHLGLLCFHLSDSALCLTWFLELEPTTMNLLRSAVMPLYYAGQFGIALSVIEPDAGE